MHGGGGTGRSTGGTKRTTCWTGTGEYVNLTACIYKILYVILCKMIVLCK